MDEDLKIVLTSELEADEQASAQRISAQLPNIARLINSRSNIRIGVTLDEAGIQSQTQRIAQQISRVTRTQSIGVSLSLDQSSINKIQTELNNLRVSPDISRTMTAQLDQMGIQIDRITGRWEAVNGEEERMLNLTIQGTDQMQRTVTYMQTYNAETGEINTHLTNVTANLERQRNIQEQLARQAQRDNESRVSYLNRQRALLADIQAAYVGQTSVKPITDSAHLTALNDAHAAVNAQIETMIATEGRLDNVQRTNLEAQIAGLQRLVKEYQNAEYVATKLRTKDIGTIRADQLSGLETLEKRLESAGALTETFKTKIDGLKTTLQGVETKDQLVAFLNSFDQLNNDVAVFQERLRGANKIYTQLISLDKQITSVRASMTKLNTSDDKNKLLALQGQLTVLNNQRASLEAQLVPYADIIQYAKQATVLEQNRLLNDNQLVYTQMEMADKAREYDAAMQTVPTTITDLENRMRQVVSPTETLIQNMESLRKTQAQYSADMGDKEKVETYERLQSLIGACNKEMTELLRIQRGNVNDFKFSQDLEKAKADLATVGRTWSALKKDPGLNAQFQQLGENLKRVDNQMDLKKWTAQFSAFKSEVKAAGKNMQSLGDILKSNVSKVLQWVSATTLLFRALRLLKSALTKITDLDTAMVDLQKVTTATREEYDRFYRSANDTAKALGVTTEEVISQTAEWARLGYTMQDAAKLAENSAIFEAISPDMDITQATDGLVSIIKAYDLEVEDSLDGIISKVNEVGNKFAVSNGNIVEALTRSSAAMAAANNTFEETVALATAAIEITRDAATVGNGLKTLSMRIRGYDEETEKYSEDVAALTGTIADLTKVASNNNQGISLFEPGDPDTYRSTYDILSDIADIWDELTDKNRADLLEALFGKRQAQIGAAILSNFDQARSAIEKMEDSTGSAGREMDKITQSLEYKLNALKETWVGVSQNLFNDETISAAIWVLQALSNLVDGLTGRLGLFGTTTIAVFGYQFIKALSASRQEIDAAKIAVAGLKFDANNLNEYVNALAGLNKQQREVVLTTANLSEAQKAAVMKEVAAIGEKKMAQVASILKTSEEVAMNKLNINSIKELTVEKLKAALAAKQITEAEYSQIVASGLMRTTNIGLSMSFKTLKASALAATAAMLTNPLTWVTVAITAVVGLISKISQMRQEAIDTANDIIDAYQTANESFNSNIGTLNGLRSRFDKLSDSVSTAGENISLTAAEYEEYLGIIDQIVDISPDIVKGYNDEGRAVLNYKTALDEAISSQEQYIANQRDIYLGEGEEIFDGKSKEWEDAAEDIGRAFEDVVAAYKGGIWTALFDTDRSYRMNDAWNAALNEVGISWDVWLDTSQNSTDKIMSMYENYDKIMVLLRNSGAYTEEELFRVQTALQGLAGAYTKLNSIESEQVEYLSEWAKSQGFYNDIPVDAWDEFASGLAGVNNPLLSYNENIQAAAQYGNAFKEAITGESAQSIIELSQGLKDGTVSIEDYNAAVEGFKDSFDGDTSVLNSLLAFFNSLSNKFVRATDDTSTYSAELLGLTDVLSALQKSYDVLKSAETDMADGGGLSPDTISALADAEENYLDYLYEENGVVKLNTAAWKENANAKMMSEMDEIQKEIDSLQERNAALEESISYYREQRSISNDGGKWNRLITEATHNLENNNNAIAENQDLLALYETIFNSIAQKTEERQVFDDQISKLKELAEAQETISDGYLISAEKAREFAEVYPELFEQATLSADGQIKLNEAVVNSFIEGKKAEIKSAIDAEILKLQAKEALLQAELDIIETQIEAAESGDDEIVNSANEAAAAKMALEQAVLSACEQAGIDETTANQLATAAMTGDWDTFRELAQQAVYDLDDESAVSFTNVMTNFAQMAGNMVDNTNKVIGAFSQMGTALKNAMNGVTTSGVKNTVTAGGSLSGSGKQAVSDLLSDMFEFEKSDYGSGGNSFDDALVEWQKQLQDIVDNYANSTEVDLSALKVKRDLINDQIASVQAQILTLQALKDTSLEGLKSDTKSGSGSSSSQKEVEEYIATIDDYREAVERLRKAQEARTDLETKIENSDDLKEQILLERQLIAAYQREQEALHNLNNQRDRTITAGVRALRELGFEVQYNADTNELWIENMEYLNELTADSKGEYDTLQEATNGLRKETEDLIKTLTDLNEENRDGSESWWELSDGIKEAQAQILELLNGIVEEASNAVDSIQDVYNTLHDAADEYAASGFITVDTLQNIIGLGQKYVSYLIDENGQLVINEDRIKAVIAARTQQLAIESSLAYVEALRIAKSEGDISALNDLLYATEQATDATWGFVYANLALVGLSADQYQAALQNINAIRAMADSAAQSVGKTVGSVTDELENMRDGLNDILGYVMDMLKQRVQDQIDSLGDMKDAYSEIIDMKKQSLKASKDEADYQKSMASKMLEIAKLQARIDLLSLDDSREAQAERAALLEEMSKLQSDLADEQEDRAREAQENALDEMEKSYQAEKDKEIEALEDSISSYQKLYDMAISYIESNWDTLYSELIAWNSQYGDVLNSEIVSAWDNCLAAAQRYGSFVSALGGVESEIHASQSDGTNLQVGDTNYGNAADNEDMIHAIIREMYANSKQHAYEDANGQLALNRRNLELGAQLARYGITAVRGSDGIWYVDRAGGEKLYEKYKKYTYHKGGVVGGGDIKSNEQIALLKDKEWVLSEQMIKNLSAQMERINQMRSLVEQLPIFVGRSLMPDLLKLSSGSTINNVTNNSNRPIEITIGDTVIYGADSTTAAQHIEITRRFANDIFGRLNIKK